MGVRAEIREVAAVDTLLHGGAVGVLDPNAGAGVEVGTTTITPKWYGDPLDLGHITTALWCADQRHPDRN